MSHPISVCIENTGAKRPAGRFTRCVAVPGSGPGLALDARGCVVWRSEEAPVCRLCVSLDGCLVLLRPEGAPKVTVRRAGRSLEAPVGKPVVLLDGDDTLLGIVRKTGGADTVAAIVKRNAIANRDRIVPGQRLKVRMRAQPGADGASTNAPAR